MDSSYRPQSPDLSSYAPQSPDLSGYNPQSPDLSSVGPHPSHHGDPYAQQHHPHHPSSAFGHQRPQGGFAGHHQQHQFGGPLHQHPPTSVPQMSSAHYPQQQQYMQQQQHPGMLQQQQQQSPYHPQIKYEGGGQQWPAAAPPYAANNKRSSRVKQEPMYDTNGHPHHQQGVFPPGLPAAPMKQEFSDPTLGCHLKTAFPVARIKRLMQADEDIGKVAQVTPTVVSRALELFMIKIISASAEQARGAPSTAAPAANGAAAAANKGPKRILVQHLKKAVLANETFDFLSEIVGKVPDAPAKGSNSKKDAAGSDSEGEAPAAAAKTKKPRAKRRAASGDDY